MYEFLDRLVNIALPRVRDFRGLNPKSFDGRGNYSLGIKEHIIFPEIDYDKAQDSLGHGHHGLHDRAHRRRGPRAADRIQLPVPAVRGLGPSNAESQETLDGEEEFDREEQRGARSWRSSMPAAASRLKAIAMDKTKPMEERFAATPEARRTAAQLVGEPRIRNRCEITGRPRAYYRKHKM